MADNKMLVDATHPEETRVVVLRGGRVEEFDYESAARKLLRGNIYLAKVTRVEPALQAAFVDYGGNRHGFLAFNEIHPDYYQIPIADRQALLEEEAAAEAEEDAAADARAEAYARRSRKRRNESSDAAITDDADGEAAIANIEITESEETDWAPEADDAAIAGDQPDREALDPAEEGISTDAPEALEPVADQDSEHVEHEDVANAQTDADSTPDDSDDTDDKPPRTIAAKIETSDDDVLSEEVPEAKKTSDEDGEEQPSEELAKPEDIESSAAADDSDTDQGSTSEANQSTDATTEPSEQVVAETGDASTDDENQTDVRSEEQTDTPETNGDTDRVEEVGSEDALEELLQRPRRMRRRYKIQEVIKRRQVLLIQVVKEERGNKGAALTTYLSLAGRYTVLMPNTARGGGISRKITNPQDRKRLKEIASELEVPEGMGLIIRTAGASRTKQEIRRDFEYLLRLWESIRMKTLESTAPCLVYEEGNLIKRSIRDLYNKDINEIVVAGEEAHREARSFMKMLMPSHVKNVTLYKEPEPLFTRHKIERQLNAMFSPYVTLRSGGYLVINQTEALVAIDVNSGRSTREFSIEETALHTNLEAAEEIARQLKLRDLAGLIVIDFIDMEEKRNNRAVERRIKDVLRNDRARIQVGRISHFGLLEMSRQRMRSGVLEGSTSQCAHCQGTGIVRSTESVALAVLRALEDTVMAGCDSPLVATTTSEVALYILNNKRAFVNDMEERHGHAISVTASDKLAGANFTVEKSETEQPTRKRRDRSVVNIDWNLESDDNTSGEAATDEDTGGTGQRRRRRRGRRTERTSASERHDQRSATPTRSDDSYNTDSADVGELNDDEDFSASAGDDSTENGNRRRRRRGRRGGRRNRGRHATQREGEHEEDINENAEIAADESSRSDTIPGLGDQPIVDVPATDIAIEPSELETKTQAAPEDNTADTSSDDAPRPKRKRGRPPRARKASEDVAKNEPLSDAEQAVTQPTNTMADPTPSDTNAAKTEPNAEQDPENSPDKAPKRRSRAPQRRTSRTADETQMSEPKIERVVIGPDSDLTNDGAASDTLSQPSRKGWWQRKVMGDNT